MTDWSKLRHAYGAADDVPRMLDRAAAGVEDPEDDLWGTLCHQGTVYTASYPAIPYLTALAEAQGPAPYVDGLHLVAAIIASSDTPDGVDVAEVRGRYADELARLDRLTLRCLALPDLDDEPGSVIYLLQALMAFRDEPVWQRELEGLANGEYEVSCPHCEQDLFVVLDDRGFFAGDADTVAVPDAARTPLLPADPDALVGAGARLYRIALDHGHTDVADLLTYLFGDAVCPACAARFSVADEIARCDERAG